jgi:hypothetical protein
MFDIVLNLADGESLDVNALKLNVHEAAGTVTGDENYESVRDQLKIKCLASAPAAPEKPKEAPPPEVPAEKLSKKDAKKAAKQEQEKEKELAGAKP